MNQGEKEPTGKAQITNGYCLPSRYVLHTVGPIYDDISPVNEGSFMYKQLSSCYETCLDLFSNTTSSESSTKDSTINTTDDTTDDTTNDAAEPEGEQEGERQLNDKTPILRKVESIAFCCISTGVFGYPNEPAASTAVNTVKKWLLAQEDAKKNDTKEGDRRYRRVVFNVFTDTDEELYNRLLSEL